MVDVQLFCTDLDGTLVGSDESVGRFRMAWDSIPAERRPTLCYNTGRLVDDALELVHAKGLPVPDFILGGVGTQAFDVARGAPLPGFQERFTEGWDLALVEDTLERDFPAALRQPPEFLHRYKSSWFLHAAPAETLAAIESRLHAAGVQAAVVYSSQRDLDVLPRRANKGKSLIWLAEYLGIPTHAILVAGDSGNDSSMFKVPGVRGIMVENAQPELVDVALATNAHTGAGVLADGVTDGLRHFGVIEPSPGPLRLHTAARGGASDLMRLERSSRRVSVAALSSRPQAILGIALFVSLTFGLSWTLVPFFGRPWPLGASVPSRLLGAVLPYVIMMGWQPAAAVSIIRAWAEPAEAPCVGERSAAERYMTLAATSALGIAGVARVVKWLVSTAPRPWFATLASALPNDPSSFDGLFSTACLAVTLLLVRAQTISEEIGFRGYLLQRSVHLLGARTGLALQAFLWGVWYAPVVLLSRGGVAGVISSGKFLLICILLGALFGAVRLVAASVAPSSVAISMLAVGAGLPFLLLRLDVGLGTTVFEPGGWLPMLLILIGIRCAGTSLAVEDRRFHSEKAALKCARPGDPTST